MCTHQPDASGVFSRRACGQPGDQHLVWMVGRSTLPPLVGTMQSTWNHARCPVVGREIIDHAKIGPIATAA